MEPPWEPSLEEELFVDFLLFFAIPFTLLATVAVFEFAIERFLIPERESVHRSLAQSDLERPETL
jgi:hypothetical protein